MPKRCNVCGRYGGSDKRLSFHPWPRTVSGRRKWMNSLEISDMDVWKTNLFICSGHFSVDDFYYKPYGKGIQHFLIPGAVPKYSKVTEVPPVKASKRCGSPLKIRIKDDHNTQNWDELNLGADAIPRIKLEKDPIAVEVKFDNPEPGTCMDSIKFEKIDFIQLAEEIVIKTESDQNTDASYSELDS